jgi:hypothetical protein
MLCFDDKDKELWQEDPHEFVRKTYDIMEDYTSQVAAHTSLRPHILAEGLVH